MWVCREEIGGRCGKDYDIVLASDVADGQTGSLGQGKNG